jgi:hypothetical protein
MTAQEIKAILEKKLSIEDFAFGDFEDEELGLGKIETVDEKGGEGEGEEWYIVYYFSTYNVYLKCDGFYQSYNGTEFYNGWGDCFEVTPQEKTITVYEKIKK